MHILQVYKDYPPIVGGIENHVRDLAEALVAQGHQVTVLVTSLQRRTETLQPQPGLTIIKAARLLHAASTPLSLAQVWLARGIRADVVHLHFPYPPGDLVALAAANRPPLVITYHSDIVRQQNLLRVYRPLLEVTLRRAARIIATSPNYVASSPFLRRYADKCAIVPLGIDTARFAPVEPAQLGAMRASLPLAPSGTGGRILFVGRLRYYKGLHVLIEAMPQINGTLLIGGDGPEREALRQQAERLGVAERVRFLGDVSDADLPALYQAADLFVMPAHVRAEALGIAQIEALASGLPSVSTEIGTGTSFVNLHGQTGFVVPPSDPTALARAINVLLANPQLRERMGAAGRERARQMFSQERMVAANVAVYREVLRDRAADR
jgi:glycosyltransferase involved in cell wall biosynthesis